jgi:hypothetical protein
MGNQQTTALQTAPTSGHKFGILKGHMYNEGTGDVIHFDHTLHVVQGQARMHFPNKPFQVSHGNASVMITVEEAIKAADANKYIDAFVYDHARGMAHFKAGVTNVCPEQVPKAEHDRYELYFKKNRYSNGDFFLTCGSIIGAGNVPF